MTKTSEDQLLALIEIPKGGRNKYEYDERLGRVVLDRFLASSTVYPLDYGFLMGHRGRDGDPLDVMVCVSEATFPGCADFSRPNPWCGLRPATPKGTPVLGATPYSNLLLNIGHGALGFTLACGCGKIIADLVSGRPPEISLDGFLAS